MIHTDEEQWWLMMVDDVDDLQLFLEASRSTNLS